MNKNITKLLVLALCAVMLIGVLSGCGDNDSSDPTTGTVPEVAEIAGTIMLNVNACVEISYDSEGLVLNVQEVDHDGHELLADYTGYLGTPCLEVVKELTEHSVNMDLLTNEFNHIVIKQLPGAKLPTETFLEDLGAAAKAAAGITVAVSIVTEADLDADGNISAKKAYDLLHNALFVAEFDLIESNEELIDGAYEFHIVTGHLDGGYIVEAATGYVYEGEVVIDDESQNADDEYQEYEDVTTAPSEEAPEDPTEEIPEPSVEA